ncbi:histidine--tRNA ligase [Paludibacterium paludis]|uniref:Histidine--tRNA ligase n=1 Tax=Paludibacterium paludis TaxID=1225769 RepID=A0A918NYX8_9NEIS|nr:histidine--tRNA ligase [Paludibacterium paludis]GGY05270.1 histidine--tRNA ligase [Paludibacterium paludis]
MSTIQSIRGMNDILPEEACRWQWLEAIVRRVTHRYGYQEIRLPILEPVALFQRAVGDATDIVAKEMYDFQDKSGDHITLRPEGTSGCVRAVIEHGLCHNRTQRLWYQGPMFRYERPQKGRFRQFHQFGVETFGMAGADIDAELILMIHDIFQALGLGGHVRLELNSLGTPDERREHRADLVAYLTARKDQLDEDSLRRLESNPLRVLDSKNPDMQALIESAPKLLDYLGDESARHFAELQGLLGEASVPFVINPRLVRGLDYYTRTVFEWTTEALGSQGTVCGGGRYDGLVELFSGKPLPASGFAFGIERLLLLIETVGTQAPVTDEPDVVVTTSSPAANVDAVLLGRQIRQAFAQLKVLNDFTGAKLARQHQRAARLGCRWVVTLNEDGSVGVWSPDEDRRVTVGRDALISTLSAWTQAR